MFLTRYKEALRSMLLMTRRPSATTEGRAENCEVEQHDMRRLTRHARAGGHGDGAVGFAQGQHVVDAVARHGDGVPRPLHGRDKLLLLIRRDAAEDGAFRSAAFASSASVLSVRASTNFSASGMPARRATSETVRGLSPEMTLRAHALLGEIREGLRRFGAGSCWTAG